MISFEDVSEATYQLCHDTLFHLREDIEAALQRVSANEQELSRHYLSLLLKNAEIARKGQLPLLQGIGLPQFFIEMGSDVSIEQGTLLEAMEDGLQQFVQEHPFRISILDDPLAPERIKHDVLPLQYHFEYTAADTLTIRCIRMMSDSEKVSRVAVFSSQELAAAVEDFVLRTVLDAQLRTTPPLLVGVGLGGSVSESSILAKKALLRPIGRPPRGLAAARLEQDILQTINQLGIGPGGFGGVCTALAVHIMSAPSMPETVPVTVLLEGCTPCISEILL